MISIVQLIPDDWEKLKEIRLKALKSDPQAFEENYESASKQTEEQWRERIIKDKRHFFIAEEDGRPVGLVGTGPSYEKTDEYVIFSVFVDKEYRGQGIGKRLLQEIMKKIASIAGVKKMSLWVNESQKQAYNLYESLGFENKGEETDPKHACGCGKTFIMEKLI